MNESQNTSLYISLARYGGLGFQLALSVVLGIFGGRALDHRLNSEPVFMLMGVILGTAVGFVGLFRAMMLNRGDAKTQSKKDEKAQSAP